MKLKPAMIFGENMILQRQKPIPVWGQSVRGDKITVTLGDTMVVTHAGDNRINENDRSGLWMATLPAMEACEKISLTISSDLTGEKIVFSNVAVGEVWLAGGQSNMEFLLKYDSQFEEILEDPNDELFRYFRFPQANFEGCLEKDPYPDDGFWRSYTSKENRGFFSAPGAYMGRQLRKILNVPVGIVACNWGGSSAAGWTKKEALYSNPALSSIVSWQEKINSETNYRAYLEASEPPAAEITAAAQAGMDQFMMGIGLLEFFKNMPEEMPVPTYTPYQYGPRSINCPGQLYEHMLKKVAPYATRGFIWYQGEEDDMCERQNIYAELMRTLVVSWRELWNEELPFLQVELAPYDGPNKRVSAKDWPMMRRQQHQLTELLPRVYDICIMDAGHPYNIHVRKKKPVGERLALLARKYVYGEEDLLADSPSLKTGSKEDGSITLTFKDTGSGLLLQEMPEDKGTLRDVLAVMVGEENIETEARIRKNQLILSSPKIRNDQPVTVKFCEMNYCTDPLFSEAGLPVFPFTITL